MDFHNNKMLLILLSFVKIHFLLNIYKISKFQLILEKVFSFKSGFYLVYRVT